MKKIITILSIFISFYSSAQQWADSVLQTLTLQQKIGQLIIIRSYAQNNDIDIKQVSEQIAKYQVGGVCFFKGTPAGLVKANNLYQSVSSIPLMISIDGEWGVSMRMDSVYAFPKQQTLGALQNDSLIYEMGRLVGLQCKRLGIHLNYVPCVDVNNNPKNPVINLRSFGENPQMVAKKGMAYASGIHSVGVMNSAKHFPGHGDTETDSHLALPVILHEPAYFDSVDLYPFKELIKQGVSSIMVSHLSIPKIDSSGMPASLSPYFIDTILKQKLQFNGLVITDGMEMKGVSDKYKNGEAEVKALLAGNDLILLPANVDRTFEAILKAVDSGVISEGLINEKCRKVLQAKYDFVLSTQFPISSDHLLSDLNTPEIKILNNLIFQNAITLVKNNHHLLPLSIEEQPIIYVISVGSTMPTVFDKTIDLYSKANHIYLPVDFPTSKIDSILDQVKNADIIIMSISNTNILAQRNYGIRPQTIKLAETLQQHKSKFILNIFASPYSLNLFNKTQRMDAIVVGYQDFPEAMEICAHQLFGALPFSGKLPVSTNEEFPVNTGLTTTTNRLRLWESQDSNTLSKATKIIDSLALNGIRIKAYPGCQILMAKNGTVVYEKAFGRHTYDSASQQVMLSDLYDLASVSKVVGTTLAVMRLYDKGKIKLNDKLSNYIPELRNTNKKNITIREVLAHQAGLKPSIFAYKDTLFEKTPSFDTVLSDDYPVQVATGIYAHKDFPDYIKNQIYHSDLLPNKSYKYSDLGFDLLAILVEKVSDMPLDEYLGQYFYQPLGLQTLTYHPLNKFSITQIVPTENDTSFRKQLIQGFVHDPTVAAMGGVGGPAGLFSNAQDLAILMQMLLQDGEYGGEIFLKKATIDTFTSVQFPFNNNRRGAGFDKPELKRTTQAPVCEAASPLSYGHSGFTGTYVWADPANQLVYIFLSNRVYPDAKNTKLSDLNIRLNIHQAAYKIFGDQ